MCKEEHASHIIKDSTLQRNQSAPFSYLMQHSLSYSTFLVLRQVIFIIPVQLQWIRGSVIPVQKRKKEFYMQPVSAGLVVANKPRVLQRKVIKLHAS